MPLIHEFRRLLVQDPLEYYVVQQQQQQQQQPGDLRQDMTLYKAFKRQEELKQDMTLYKAVQQYKQRMQELVQQYQQRMQETVQQHQQRNQLISRRGYTYPRTVVTQEQLDSGVQEVYSSTFGAISESGRQQSDPVAKVIVSFVGGFFEGATSLFNPLAWYMAVRGLAGFVTDPVGSVRSVWEGITSDPLHSLSRLFGSMLGSAVTVKAFAKLLSSPTNYLRQQKYRVLIEDPRATEFYQEGSRITTIHKARVGTVKDVAWLRGEIKEIVTPRGSAYSAKFYGVSLKDEPVILRGGVIKGYGMRAIILPDEYFVDKGLWMSAGKITSFSDDVARIEVHTLLKGGVSSGTKLSNIVGEAPVMQAGQVVGTVSGGGGLASVVGGASGIASTLSALAGEQGQEIKVESDLRQDVTLYKHSKYGNYESVLTSSPVSIPTTPSLERSVKEGGEQRELTDPSRDIIPSPKPLIEPKPLHGALPKPTRLLTDAELPRLQALPTIKTELKPLTTPVSRAERHEKTAQHTLTPALSKTVTLPKLPAIDKNLYLASPRKRKTRKTKRLNIYGNPLKIIW